MNVTALPERMQDKIRIADSGCWLWVGATTSDGYGLVHAGKLRPAHRVTYELLVGPIPPGLQIDHLCRVRNCLNPGHLEPVTQAENIRRGIAGSGDLQRARCPRNHPYEGDNLRTYTNRNGETQRVCRACSALAAARYRERKRATQLAPT